MVATQAESLPTGELLQAKSGRVGVRESGSLTVSQKQVEQCFFVMLKHSQELLL